MPSPNVLTRRSVPGFGIEYTRSSTLDDESRVWTPAPAAENTVTFRTVQPVQ